MTSTLRKVQKAPCDLIDVGEIPLPIYYSTKLDGYRCVYINGAPHSATMREYDNIHLRKMLKPLVRRSNWIFDGELYAHGEPFEAHGKIRSKSKPLPPALRFWIFDAIHVDDWDKPLTKFADRYVNLKRLLENVDAPGLKVVQQRMATTHEQLDNWFRADIDDGFEGGIARTPDAPYKHGRCTVKQAQMFKLKDFVDYDAKIIEVHEMMGIREGAERTLDPLGHRKAVHKKEDLEPKGTFGHFVVALDQDQFPNAETMVIGGWKGLSFEKRAKIWANKKKYPGQWIRFQGQSVGIKDRPRIPKNVQFRDSK